MSVLYFIPDISPPDVDDALLSRLGMRGVLADTTVPELAVNLVERGPNGQRGVIVFAIPVEGLVKHAGFREDVQEWRELDGYWLGWNRDHKPCPESLRRSMQVAGQWVKLGDGQMWLAPTIRRYLPSACLLPQAWGFDAQRNFVPKVLPAYEHYWELSGEIFDAVFGSAPASPEQLATWCVELLSINYRVGLHEATALGLVDSTNFRPVIHASIEADLLSDFLRSPEGMELVASIGLESQKKSQEPVRGALSSVLGTPEG